MLNFSTNYLLKVTLNAVKLRKRFVHLGKSLKNGQFSLNKDVFFSPFHTTFGYWCAENDSVGNIETVINLSLGINL